jgi:hypothetical protein
MPRTAASSGNGAGSASSGPSHASGVNPEYGTSAPATSRAYGTGPDGMRTAQERANNAEGVNAAPAPTAASGSPSTGTASTSTMGNGDRATTPSRSASARSERTASASRSSSRGTASTSASGRGASASTTAGVNGHDAQTVREVQQTLSQRGFDPGPIDGLWGPRTQAALRQFQQAQGMAASGTLDAATMSALDVQGGSVASGFNGSSGPATASPSAEAQAGSSAGSGPSAAGAGGATGSPAR